MSSQVDFQKWHFDNFGWSPQSQPDGTYLTDEVKLRHIVWKLTVDSHPPVEVARAERVDALEERIADVEYTVMPMRRMGPNPRHQARMDQEQRDAMTKAFKQAMEKKDD